MAFDTSPRSVFWFLIYAACGGRSFSEVRLTIFPHSLHRRSPTNRLTARVDIERSERGAWGNTSRMGPSHPAKMAPTRPINSFLCIRSGEIRRKWLLARGKSARAASSYIAVLLLH